MLRTLILLVLSTVLLASTTEETSASFRTWKDTSGGLIEADLESFDIANKAIVLVDDSGGKHRVATQSLTTRSRFQLLFSSRFLQAFPEDKWKAQRLQVILTLTAITGFFFLIGFWLAAIFVVHNPNPFKAILGWIGSLVVAFLFFVYLTTARKFPEYTAAILGVGTAVSFIFAAVSVSAIYHSKIGSALALFILHFAAGVLLLIGGLHALDLYPLPPEAEDFLNKNVFESVGLL